MRKTHFMYKLTTKINDERKKEERKLQDPVSWGGRGHRHAPETTGSGDTVTQFLCLQNLMTLPFG